MKNQIAITNSTILNDLPDVLTVTSPPRYGYTTREKPWKHWGFEHFSCNHARYKN